MRMGLAPNDMSLLLSSQSLFIHLHCFDPFDIGTIIDDWDWELNQLEAGEFHGSALVLQLDPVRVARVNINRPALHRLRCIAHGHTVLMRGRSSGPVFVAGYLLRDSDYVLLEFGTEIELLCHAQSSVIAISLWGEAPTGLNAAGAGKLLPVRGTARLLSATASSLEGLPDRIDQAGITLLSETTKYPNAIARASLAQALLMSLSGAAAGTSGDLDSRRPSRRHIAVERARNYIREHLTEPIKLADLCQYAHVQERSLEYGFREVAGLRPMAYIKMLRLCEVHRRLLSDSYMDRSISQVALDCGFCHLGQFSNDYKRLFLESPSLTRLRARSRIDRISPSLLANRPNAAARIASRS
jgi:AraC family transcriptional regulator, ethanolamine operon transcriptional activator